MIDLANLNAHFPIPVFSRAGKGISFSYSLNYDSLVWQVITNGSGQLQWSPMPNWGWRGSTEPTTGYVSYSYADKVIKCGSNNVEKESWTQFVYHDPMGVPHPFTGTVYVYDDPGCGNGKTTLTATANDNSGYQIQISSVSSGETNLPTTITAASGVKISPPSVTSSGSGTVQDTNGNSISVNSSGTATFTDTLNTTALTVSGAAPNPVTYTYTAPAGSAHVTMTYTAYVVQTNFNVTSNGSRILEYGPTVVYLVSSVTLADGTVYSFGYESTGGVSGTYTGRIASVTLPTGGTVSYSYANSACSNTSNCMMADGSPSNMTRILGGTNVTSGTWTYTRAYQSGPTTPTQTTTTVLDPSSNETDLNFSGIYETMRHVSIRVAQAGHCSSTPSLVTTTTLQTVRPQRLRPRLPQRCCPTAWIGMVGMRPTPIPTTVTDSLPRRTITTIRLEIL